MNNFYVYAHINPVTNQFFYIGKGKDKRAWGTSLRNRFWKNVVAKYGFSVKILVENLAEEQAFEIERQYIGIYKSRINGGCLVNLTDGGEGASGFRITGRKGTIPGEATKAKLKQSKTGFLNPNHGKKTWNFGIPRTDEEKRKMSAAKTGLIQNAEVKAKSLAALEKARAAQKEKMFKIRCMSTGTVWLNKWDCIESLGIKETRFKDMTRGGNGRGKQRLEYLK